MARLTKTTQPEPAKPRAKKLALLIASHNGELVLGNLLQSAINAGMDARDIYVVDDDSDDATYSIAKGIVGKSNVLKVRRSGKGLALSKASKKFRLSERYRWIHIADDDGGFSRDYFAVLRRELNTKYAAATGYVRSLPGPSVSQYRVFEYTVGQEVHRRFQALVHTVSVIPGPTSIFRADVFAKVNFANHALTEDFDVTLQIHRQKLGRIQFIPDAIAYTQDPRNLHDFVRQITRWNRGIMQGVLRHKIGRRRQRIDAYLSWQIIQNLLFFFSYFLIAPAVALLQHSSAVLAATFLYDVILLFGMAVLTSMRSGRWDVMSAFPLLYLYRWVTLYVFLRSFVEVVILRRFRITQGHWATEGRRYKQTVTL
ncbi:glycosyltransferase family 2 protein [Candidatus Saccharibacteria bacterium]|nr:glycosyltransferase family 2 protein [Candidatus Saccharibacteria bacterium]